MKNDRVVLNFVRMPVPQKIEFGRNVEARLRKNPVFEQPDVSCDDLKACTDLLETRYVASIKGGKMATALLHQADDEWVELMRNEAKYVDRIANGDATIILNAGFSMAKQRSAAGRPEFTVELGDKSGTVLLRRQRVIGGRAYIWQYVQGDFPTDDANWIVAQITTQASVELSGLTPLSRYWFRVAVVTPQGTGPFTTPIMQSVI